MELNSCYFKAVDLNLTGGASLEYLKDAEKKCKKIIFTKEV
jgi:hypothetical protein